MKVTRHVEGIAIVQDGEVRKRGRFRERRGKK